MASDSVKIKDKNVRNNTIQEIRIYLFNILKNYLTDFYNHLNTNMSTDFKDNNNYFYLDRYITTSYTTTSEIILTFNINLNSVIIANSNHIFKSNNAIVF